MNFIFRIFFLRLKILQFNIINIIMQKIFYDPSLFLLFCFGGHNWYFAMR